MSQLPTTRPRFRAVIVHQSDGLRLALRGELDMGTAPDLAKAVERAGRHAPRKIYLDASKVTFIDVAGARALVEAAAQARAAGKSLKLERPSPAVRRVMRLLVAIPAAATTMENHGLIDWGTARLVTGDGLR